MRFKYRETVLNELARHGVIPGEGTPPELIHEFVNDLYLFEIRSLRNDLLEGRVRKEDYANRVLMLRNRYPILSLPVRFWIEADEPGAVPVT